MAAYANLYTQVSPVRGHEATPRAVPAEHSKLLAIHCSFLGNIPASSGRQPSRG